MFFYGIYVCSGQEGEVGDSFPKFKFCIKLLYTHFPLYLSRTYLDAASAF